MSRDGALQRELQQNRPFRSLSQEAALSILRTADLVRRRFDALLAPSGLTQQQYNVLRILRGASEDGLATLTIADRMVERTPGITRLIDRLMAKGFVDRERAADDRRRVVCRITPKGLELLAELEEPINTADDQVIGMLSRDEQQRLIELLDRIRQDHESS